jgi:hypothetical protein
VNSEDKAHHEAHEPTREVEALHETITHLAPPFLARFFISLRTFAAMARRCLRFNFTEHPPSW